MVSENEITHVVCEESATASEEATQKHAIPHLLKHMSINKTSPSTRTQQVKIFVLEAWSAHPYTNLGDAINDSSILAL